VIGPGDIAQAHAADEFVELPSWNGSELCALALLKAWLRLPDRAAA
jgi:acetylornithine deacetylase/succinyl-diaminopimelate desuccinylase-like protein